MHENVCGLVVGHFGAGFHIVESFRVCQYGMDVKRCCLQWLPQLPRTEHNLQHNLDLQVSWSSLLWNFLNDHIFRRFTHGTLYRSIDKVANGGLCWESVNAHSDLKLSISLPTKLAQLLVHQWQHVVICCFYTWACRICHRNFIGMRFSKMCSYTCHNVCIKGMIWGVVLAMFIFKCW